MRTPARQLWAWAPPLAVLWLLFVVFGGCGARDWEAPLPNGYSVTSPQSGLVVIADKDGFVVLPKDLSVPMTIGITGMAVVDPLVLGRSQAPGGAAAFFILDTRAGTVTAFPNQAEWARALAGLGITTVPDLPRPANPNDPWSFLIGLFCGLPVVSGCVSFGLFTWWRMKRGSAADSTGRMEPLTGGIPTRDPGQEGRRVKEAARARRVEWLAGNREPRNLRQ